MNEEQKANLLKHADFLDNVVNVKFTDGLEMAVYYSFADPADKPGMSKEEWYELAIEGGNLGPEDIDDLLEPLPKENCGFCACAIGWAAKSDLPKPKDHEEWDEYSERIFGINNHDTSQGEYCFSDRLKITDASVIADRIRKVVAAYPEKLEIEPEFLRH